MSLETILSSINTFIWGPPLLILLSGTGVYLTLRLGFLQIIHLPRALGYLFKKEKEAKKGMFLPLPLFVPLWRRPLVPVISLVWQPRFKPADQGQFFGCGWWHCWVWQPNTPNVYWQ